MGKERSNLLVAVGVSPGALGLAPLSGGFVGLLQRLQLTSVLASPAFLVLPLGKDLLQNRLLVDP